MTVSPPEAPVRVLLVESEFHILGGGHFSLLTLIRNLDRERVHTEVVCFGEGEFSRRAEEAGVAVHLLKRKGGVRDLMLIFKLARLSRQFDLVHVNTLDIRAGLAARLALRPLIGHLRVIFPFTWVDRLFAILSDRVIAVSQAARDAFCRNQPDLLGRFVVVPNTVAVDMGARCDIRKDLRLPRDSKLVGVVGRIEALKGLTFLIGAAGRLNLPHIEIHYLIVGEPDSADVEAVSYQQNLVSKVAARGLSDVVHFLGFRPDAHALIEQLDVLVVPSIVISTPAGERTEGFGRVVLEGMAVGTPVVASCAGGMPELIDHARTGLLVQPEDDAALADAIHQVLENPEDSDRMAEAARDRFLQHYGLDAHLKKMESLYRALVPGYVRRS